MFKKLFPHITCKDGTTLSVQASENHYCKPRNNVGPYTHVEVGYPSTYPPDTWRDYADGDPDNSDVWGYIPTELVEAYITAHGGIDLGKTLARKESN